MLSSRMSCRAGELLVSVTRQQLLQKIAYLLAENRILRSKLPDRISLNKQERLKLVRAGKELGVFVLRNF